MQNIKNIQDYRFFQDLIALPYIEGIILYGSRARGDSQERSDIDLAISCPKAIDNDWQKIIQIVEEADTLLKIDLVRIESLSANNPLLISIKNEGKILYSKT